MSRGGNSSRRICFWCGRRIGIDGITRDHMIPQWARRTLPFYGQMMPRRGMVVACADCNQAKGALPPAVFHGARNHLASLRAAHAEWREIRIQLHDRTNPANDALAAMVATHMRARVPRTSTRSLPAIKSDAGEAAP